MLSVIVIAAFKVDKHYSKLFLEEYITDDLEISSDESDEKTSDESNGKSSDEE